MNVKKLLVLIILLLMLPGPVGAQTDATWYFAVGDGQLVAYTASGETNVLFEDGVDESVYGWRLSPQSALVALALDTGLYAFYHLTPDAAQPLTFDFETEGFPQQVVANGTVVAHRDPYVALVLPEGATNLGLLVNLEAGTVAQLQNRPYHPVFGYSARFSADGQSLRYLGSAPDDNLTWMLQEVDLASGEERTIHTLSPDDAPYITTDTYGEQWIMSVRGETSHTETLLGSDGSLEVLPGDQIMEGRTLTQLFEDDVIAYVPCNDQCWLMLNPGTENESHAIFVVPQITSRIKPVARIDDLTLLVQMRQEYLLLEDEADGGFKMAGLLGYEGTGTIIPMPGKATWSGRWLVTVDQYPDPTAYQVWDVASRAIVLEGGPGTADTFWLGWFTYGEGGFVMGEQTQEGAHYYLYRASDETVIEIPEPRNGEYMEVLIDGAALYTQSRDSDALSGGIYRYDPDTETYTLLVAGMEPVDLK